MTSHPVLWATCPNPVPSLLSRSAAPVTRWTRRSWPVGSRRTAGSWSRTPPTPTSAVVNTCGFVDAAKKDSVDALLEANDLKAQGRTQAVVAVGCMAERYGRELADALPEADGVLGFDDYADISDRLSTILSGGVHASHTPRDRRKLLPISPADRQSTQGVALPGHGHDEGSGAEPATDSGQGTGFEEGAQDLPEGVAPSSGPRAPLRRRLDAGPVASVKLASGCDRRCTFCAIPSFRGSFISRRPSDVLGEASWLAEQGVREVMLVSENNTSYGKDLGDIRLLETLLPELAAVDGIERVRVSYLQPAEMRPGLIEVLTGTPGVVPYFDLSFQHSAPGVLRADAALRRHRPLPRPARHRSGPSAPEAGVRSNFIVGFPGETEEDLAELERFLGSARGWTPSASSATPTRTAPRRRPSTASWTRTWSPPGSPGCRGWPRS